ncbi:MAG: UDP-N-acetylmuramyl-tripeptide synthetase [Candidatus Roizmanbacteria bacterium]
MWRKLKNLYHWSVSWAAHAYYGFPASKLKLIGITGTDGKTTTSSLIYHVLKSVGKKVSVITTVSATIGGVSQDTGFHVTTPDPHQIPKFLAQAVANGDEYMVFEITSHGLDQHRAAPLRFEVSGITNVTHEHLDYHKTMDKYIAAKAKLVSLSKLTFINADQVDIAQKLAKLSKGHKILTYGLAQSADINIDVSNKFNVVLESYNKYNFLLAYSICHHLGVLDDQFAHAIKSFLFPAGRMEVVYDEDITAIVDFAHTPNAIHEALSAIQTRFPDRRIVHVFGAAGKRDTSKRPEMGQSSASYATRVILTEEDYRNEDPQHIADMIAGGLRMGGFTFVAPDRMQSIRKNMTDKLYTFVADRSEAVRLAVDSAVPGDVIVLTGKAHETTLCRGKTEYPYSEHDALVKSIDQRKLTPK